jgi:hypothetical protein
VVVLRCSFCGLAAGLLLAGCAGQVDISKYALPERDAFAPPIRSFRSDINPDGTFVNPYPVSDPRGVTQRNVSKQMDQRRADAKQEPTEQQDRPTEYSSIGTPHSLSVLSLGQSARPVDPTFLERLTHADQENQALNKKTIICRGC